MRRWIGPSVLVAFCAACIALALLATLTHRPSVWVTPVRSMTACASSDCGSFAATMHWGAIPWAHTTSGYNIILNANTTFATVSSSTTSYTFTGMDCGTTFTMGVQAKDSGSDLSSALDTSYTTPACSGAPSNSSLPTISGTANTGQALSATTGSWTNSPSSYSYQWQDCNGSCVNIVGATSSSYTLASADLGYTIDVVVTATNGSGATPATSSATAASTSGNSYSFADEFSNSSVDLTQWAPLNGLGESDQSEPECYFPSHDVEASGNLTITATYDATAQTCGDGNTTNYLSGALDWRTGDYTYGTVTVSAEFPSEDGGAWPAIWELGTACRSSTLGTYLVANGNWPTAGGSNGTCGGATPDTSAGTEEIDIADGCCNGGSPGTAFENNIFPTEPSNTGGDPCGVNSVSPNMESNFHTFSMTWTSTQVSWSLDGSVTCTRVNPGASCSGLTNCGQLPSGDSIPTTPEFFILNMAVGGCCGSNGGTLGITNADFPVTYKVAYVHVTSSTAVVPTLAPQVTGTPTHGDVLSCSHGTWTNSPTSYTYQWFQDNTTLISGATSSTYTLQTTDETHQISCVVTAHNSASATAQASQLTPTVN